MGSSEGQSVPSLSLSFWCNPATFGVPSFEVYLSNLYRPHHAAFVPLCASTFPSFYEDSSNGIGLIQYELFKNSITSAKTLFPDKITFTRGLGLKTSEAHLLGKHDSIYNILIPQYLNYRISKTEWISTRGGTNFTQGWTKSQYVGLCTLSWRQG